MPKLFLLLASVLLVLFSCKKDEKLTYPSCIQQYVNNANYNVYEYSYAQEIYFMVEPKNLSQMPDGGSQVFTSNCQEAGYLGGIGGNTKINGVEFSQFILVKKL